MIGKTRRSRCWGFGLVALAGMAFVTANVEAGQVYYGGSVGWGGNDDPVQYGFVIAGTFAPSFDPLFYNMVYGGGPGSGIETTRYSQAVKDGNWIPVAPGTLTGKDGKYLGVGTTKPSQIGEQLFVFCFNDPDPNKATRLALCTSSIADWTAGSTNYLYAKDANVIIYGSDSNKYDVALQAVMFVPEPSTVILLLTGLAFGGLGLLKKRRSAA
ncbi:MAG: PEP-CTERM sorting domain-containing protein [Pirellulales bacterium]|nr:PEP-CTERM sorting domain-containing protein [Pirellulales bacterium]